MYAGVWDTISDIITGVGVTPETTAAIAKALVSPTLANIQGVKDAFAAAGTSAPPELLNLLYGRYYDSVAQNPYASTGTTLSTVSEWLPWVLGGGLVLIALASRRKR